MAWITPLQGLELSAYIALHGVGPDKVWIDKPVSHSQLAYETWMFGGEHGLLERYFDLLTTGQTGDYSLYYVGNILSVIHIPTGKGIGVVPVGSDSGDFWMEVGLIVVSLAAGYAMGHLAGSLTVEAAAAGLAGEAFAASAYVVGSYTATFVLGDIIGEESSTAGAAFGLGAYLGRFEGYYDATARKASEAWTRLTDYNAWPGSEGYNQAAFQHWYGPEGVYPGGEGLIELMEGSADYRALMWLDEEMSAFSLQYISSLFY